MNHEETYIKGFNAGYILSQYEPQLLEKLIKNSSGKDEYFQALKDGKAEQEKEKLLDRIKSQSKNKGLER